MKGNLRYFEKIITYCDTYSNRIPLSFILGFYVSLVMTRWWNQYCSIPFPDNLAIIVGASVKGQVCRKSAAMTDNLNNSLRMNKQEL